MRGASGPTVLKLGGSYAFSPFLKNWIDAVKDCAGCVVLVPGGGPFADAVRAAQPRMGFDDRTAHEMAVLAMDQYGCALAHLGVPLRRAASAAAIRDVLRAGGVPVWSPAQMIRGEKDIPWCWDVTSDSLAAWLAGRLGAKRVLLVKHADVPTGPLRATDLVDPGQVRLQRPALKPPSPVLPGIRRLPSPSATGNWSAPASICVSCIPLR